MCHGIRLSRRFHFDVAIISKPPKQTDTTQRWKLLLGFKNVSISVPTKIEFSRRKMDEGVACVAIDSDVINQYHLYPIICNHYECNMAFLQKVSALINRTETQARDIFDLKWLLDQGAKVNLVDFSIQDVQAAIHNAEAINYADFKGQVIAYLMDEYKEFYDSVEKWNEIRAQVITALREKTG